MLNTHYYDGKMGLMINCVMSDINRAGAVQKDVKTTAFYELKRDLEIRFSYHDGMMEKLIHLHIAHGRQTGSPLHDTSNGLFACDLLWLLYEKVVINKSVSHGELLVLALEDMESGMCPEGICTRFFQVLIMMEDKLP